MKVCAAQANSTLQQMYSRYQLLGYESNYSVDKEVEDWGINRDLTWNQIANDQKLEIHV